MNKKIVPLVALLIVITLLGVFAFAYYKTQEAERLQDIIDPTTSPEDIAFDALEKYIKEHISELSPVKETLGGTFFVTRIRAYDNEGTVEYEDGHNAYTASFTYTIEGDTVSVQNFSVVAP